MRSGIRQAEEPVCVHDLAGYDGMILCNARGWAPVSRVDDLMIPQDEAFACVIAAAVWHYARRGVPGWLWSLGVIAVVYFTLSILLDTRKKFARRTYRFAE